MWKETINQWTKVMNGNSASARIKGRTNVTFKPLPQARIKPPPQLADPRLLAGVSLIMR